MSEPTWEEVMAPFRASDRWLQVRAAAAASIEADHAEMGCAGQFGISSSDVNHTVHGIAVWLYRQGVREAALVDQTTTILQERSA